MEDGWSKVIVWTETSVGKIIEVLFTNMIMPQKDNYQFYQNSEKCILVRTQAEEEETEKEREKERERDRERERLKVLYIS